MIRAHVSFWLGMLGGLLVLGVVSWAYQEYVVTPERRILLAERNFAEASRRALVQQHEALAMRAAALEARSEAQEATLRAVPVESLTRLMLVPWRPLPLDRAYYVHLHAAGLVPKITHEGR